MVGVLCSYRVPGVVSAASRHLALLCSITKSARGTVASHTRRSHLFAYDPWSVLIALFRNFDQHSASERIIAVIILIRADPPLKRGKRANGVGFQWYLPRVSATPTPHRPFNLDFRALSPPDADTVSRPPNKKPTRYDGAKE